MKLWRCSGSEPQSGEDGIGSGPFRFASDPILHSGQSLGRLMDIVAIDVGDGFEQLSDAFVATVGQVKGRRTIVAPRHGRDAARSVVLSHPIAFPRDGSAIPQHATFSE
jgi:hypothetical protein